MPVKRRQRGCILTFEGLKKLQQRIYDLESTKGIKYSASKIAEIAQLNDPAGLHPTTVRKVLRQESVDKTSLELLFTVLNLTLISEDYNQPYQPSDITQKAQQDWGESSEISDFYGRQPEIEGLRQCIISDHSRLIAILGMGGIGKTTLATQLAHQLTEHFSYIIWRSLRHAPSLNELLETILAVFVESPSQFSTVRQQITAILNFFKEFRCLLILDNLETLFQAKDSVGCYQSDYDLYEEFLERMLMNNHQSCLILTSREKPQIFTLYENQNLPIRSLLLKGIEAKAGEMILKTKALEGTEEDLKNLTQLYQGNPLALKMVATSIQTLFAGKVQPFLIQKIEVFHGIRILFEQQLERLSPLETQVLYELTIARYPRNIEKLQLYLFPPISLSRLLETLEFLSQRSLIETTAESSSSYELHPVLMEYLTEKLINKIRQEIVNVSLDDTCFLKQYGLLKAQDKDYIRQSQIQFLVLPLLEQLKIQLGSQSKVEQQLRKMLQILREMSPVEPGYLGGNLLNLLVQLSTDLTGLDLSHLTLWQVYLKETNLHDVNLSSANVSGCVFRQTFDNIYSLAFSQDSKLLATGHQNGEIRLWRIADGALISTWQEHQQTVWCLAFNSEQQTLASGSFEGHIILWHLTTEQPICRMRGHQNWIWSLAFRPDGNTLASGSRDGTIKLWDVKTGECQQTLAGCTEGVTYVNFSSDGRILASGGGTGEIQRWHWLQGKWIASQRWSGHRSRITGIAFHPNRLLMATSAAESVKIWNLETESCITTWKEELTAVWGIAFSPDGQTLALSDQKTIKLWDLEDNQCFQTFMGYNSQVWSIAFSPDGNTLAGCDKQQVIFWNPITGQQLQTLQAYQNAVTTLAIHHPESLFASGSSDGLVRIWGIQQRNCLYKRQLSSKTIRSVRFSPDGQLLASGADDGKVCLWHWQAEQTEILRPLHQKRVWSVTFSPDGHWLASGGEDETLLLWNLKKRSGGKRLFGHQGWVLSTCFSPDNCFFVSGGVDKTIRLWNLPQGNCYKILQGHTGWVWSVVISPQGQLISAGEDATLRLWEINSGNAQILRGHKGIIWSVIISPDGQWLASSSIDQTIRLWELKTGKCQHIFSCEEGTKAIAFTSDGKYLISGNLIGSMQIWELKTANCLDTFVLDNPYKGINVQNLTGLTENQKAVIQRISEQKNDK